MREDAEVKNALTAQLGKEIYTPSGEIDRKVLGLKLFRDREIRDFVNSVVHAAVRKDILKLRDHTEGVMFIESAIMASGGIAGYCNQIWIVTAPEKIRIERVMARDGHTVEEVEERIRTQQNELRLLKDYDTLAICNDGIHPILGEILKLTNKYIDNQTYITTC